MLSVVMLTVSMLSDVMLRKAFYAEFRYAEYGGVGLTARYFKYSFVPLPYLSRLCFRESLKTKAGPAAMY
jgi:hypothetical protein